MGQEYSSVTKTITDPVNAAITFNSATLDLSEKQLSINFSGDNSYGDINSYGCQYVLTVDGVNYRLRGRSGAYILENGGNIIFNAPNLFDLDFDNISVGSTVTLSLDYIGNEYDYGVKDSSGKIINSFTVDVTVTE